MNVKLQIGVFNKIAVIPECDFHTEKGMKLVSLIIQIYARQLLTSSLSSFFPSSFFFFFHIRFRAEN